jgi:cytochrome b561
VSDRWSTRSVVLHWVSAGIVAALATAGFVMSDLPADSNLRLLLSRSHTLLGVTLMALTVARLVVRWRGKSPDPLPLSALHRRFVSVVHGAIYVLVFGLGASGLVTALLTAWPSYVRGERALAPDLEHVASREVHETLVFGLLLLVALHVVGVLAQELRRGGALRRMIPFMREEK